MNRLQADLMLLAIALVWGLAFVFQKTAMAHIGPFAFLAARSILAAAALALIAIWFEKNTRRSSGHGFWRYSVVAGVAFFLGAILQQAGIVTATVTNSGFLTGLYVVITPLLLWLVLAEPPRVHVWPAVGMAFAGAWLLGGGTIGGFSPGDWLVALSAVFWAAHIIIVARAARHLGPVAFTAAQFAVVALLATCGALLFEEVSLTRIIAAGGEILYVGLLSSALTFTLLAVAMRSTPPAEAAILVSMETVFAALAGMLLLGERLGAVALAGAAMMVVATVLVNAGAYFHHAGKPKSR
ncbi:MAG: hypothetical protein RLZ98_3652 [Pseudomonadota bacterium]|jgi:drug/metabolite transporter (DMT)-like permease